jgi:hypothetical protein
MSLNVGVCNGAGGYRLNAQALQSQYRILMSADLHERPR